MSIIEVNISKCVLSTDPEVVLVTHSLGSCLGVSFHDYRKKTGLMIHSLLPFYQKTQKKLKDPAMFVDTGVENAIQQLEKMGCHKHDIVVKAAGASLIMDPKGIFNIWKRNYEAFQQSMKKQGMAIKNVAVGWDGYRTLCLEIKTGQVIVKSHQQVTEL